MRSSVQGDCGEQAPEMKQRKMSIPNRSMSPLLRVGQEGRGAFLNQSVCGRRCVCALWVLPGILPLGAYAEGLFPLVLIPLLKKTLSIPSFAVAFALFCLVFSLSPPGLVWFPQTKGCRGIRSPVIRGLGEGAPAEAGLPVAWREAQAAGCLPLAARRGSWLPSLPPTAAKAAGPPAHTAR